MCQAAPLTSGILKMSACSEFVEHIWKPGSCKNCFYLQSDHQLQWSSSAVQPGASRRGPPEEEGCGPSPCTKPTIAVKPTMMSAESTDAWTGMEVGPEAPQVLWRPTPSKLPFPEPRDTTRTFSGSSLSPHSLSAGAWLGLPSLARPGNKDEGGHQDSANPPCQESPPTSHQSLHQKLAAFLERAGSSSVPRTGGLPAASRGKDLQPLPCRDLDGGEYCSIANWCPASTPGPRGGHGKARPGPRGAEETTSTCEEGWGPGLSREHCCEEPPENSCPFTLAQRRLPQALEAASLSDGLSSPAAGPGDSDYCSLARQPELRKPYGPGPNGGSPSKSPGSPPHSSERISPEPIYAEISKRKKPCPASSTLPCTSEKAGHSLGQDPAGESWGQGRPQPSVVPQVAAKVTVLAAHMEDDQRTIYLSSPDSAVGVQWPCGHIGPGLEDTSVPTLDTSSREQLLHNRLPGPGPRGEDLGRSCPAIPPKVCKGSPGGAPGSPESSPLAQLKDGYWSQPAVPGPTDTLSSSSSSSSSSSFSARELSRCLVPAQSSSWDQRRPRFQVGARNYQGRIEEEDGEGELASGPAGLGMAREMEQASRNQRSRAESISEQPSRAEGAAGPGMSKSASFAFEFPKARSEAEAFSPPPPPPKSRHLLRMNKSSSDLEQASLSLAESLSPPGFSGIRVHFTTGSTDSLTSDSQTCSDRGHSCELAPCPSPGCPSEDGSPRGPLQPPPLPQKKMVSRAASSPDGLFLAQGSPGHQTSTPRLNPSHSEMSICPPEASRFLGPGLGGCPRGPEAQLQACQGFSPSSSQLSMASQTSASSSQQQLPSLLTSITSKEATYAKLSGLYAQSLVRLSARCERHFMGSPGSEPHFSENSWSLFKLTCNKPCCEAGDAIYYCATCSEDPSQPYAVKICKTPMSKGASYCELSVPVHFNLQQDCGHFVASVPSSMLLSPEESQDQDCAVVITREVPHQTTADFVRDSASWHWAEPEAYERRVCLLLLQLCQGLESLKEHGITHRALCLENLLLAPCPGASPGDQPLPRLIISNFLQAKQQAWASGGSGPDEQQRRTQARLAPEILVAAQYKKVDEFQTGILIYELLHRPNPFEERAQLQQQDYRAEDLPLVPALSLYSAGLQRLAHRLLEADPIKRLHIAEAKRALQCLLWGPRHELPQGPLHNWLHMKRALLMMKLAEKALDQRAAVELEDWLCCQYLASAEPAALLQALRLLQPL